MGNRKITWNSKVAGARGSSWKAKLLSGRLHIQMHPSVLRVKRIKSNRTQEEIAALCKMNASTYGAIESGQRMLKGEQAEKIAQVVGVSFDKAFDFVKIGNGRYRAALSKTKGSEA